MKSSFSSRFIAALSLLITQFVFGCVHSAGTWMENIEGDTARACSLPVMLALADDIPERRRDAVVRGFEYWNDAIGERLFFYGGVVPQELKGPGGRGYVVVGSAENDDLLSAHAYATTRVRIENDGCIATGQMLVATRAFSLDDAELETVARHEAGHLLGLGHSPFTALDVMAAHLEPSAQHPLDASSDAIEQARAVYAPSREFKTTYRPQEASAQPLPPPRK